jgi:glycerate kinase
VRVKVVIAPDKFRGSLTAAEAAIAIAEGVRRAHPSAQIVSVPMADGGEGTVEALVAATGGTCGEAIVSGPLGDPVSARFGLLGDGVSAVLEMATASGLALIPGDRRDPMRASTRGTGELLLSAIDAGASRILIGIGGSATNDGGAGFAQALGYRLLDRDGLDLPPGGGSLDRIDHIDPSGHDGRLEGVSISAACDVNNPLCGPSGASAVFGPQKGASAEDVIRLDRNLANFARVISRDLKRDVKDVAGAGAAGGLGAGLIAFAEATLQPGIELVANAVDLEGKLRGADLLLTGEGAIDGSSVGGKTAVGVGRIAQRLGVPAIALAGTISADSRGVLDCGLVAYASLCCRPMTLDQAIADARSLLTDAAEQVVRIFLAGRPS